MKTRLLILSLFIPLFSSAQFKLTTGEVFDFEVGDEFHYEVRVDFYKMPPVASENGPPDYDKVTISQKWNDISNTTVYYERSHVYYNTRIDYKTGFEFDISYFKDTVSYTQLDSSLMYYNWDLGYYEYLSQTEPDVYFTFKPDSIETRDGEYYELRQYLYNYKKEYSIQKFVRGLGLVYDYYHYEAKPYWNEKELRYYKKGNEEYGSRISLSSNSIQIVELKVYPIPATSILHIDGISTFLYTIVNTQGLMVKSGDGINNSIEVNELPSGIYFITLQSSEGVFRKKIVKQ